MSTEIVVALIGLAGILLAPIIQALAARPRSGHIVQRLPLLLFALGLVLLTGVTLRLWLGGGRPDVIDLGSTWDVRDSRVVSDLGADRPLVYAHTPVGKFRYLRVAVEEGLVRVNRVCGLQREDITFLFTRTNLGSGEPPTYTSGILEVDPSCSIEFSVRRPAGRPAIIELVAEPIP